MFPTFKLQFLFSASNQLKVNRKQRPTFRISCKIILCSLVLLLNVLARLIPFINLVQRFSKGGTPVNSDETMATASPIICNGNGLSLRIFTDFFAFNGSYRIFYSSPCSEII